MDCVRRQISSVMAKFDRERVTENCLPALGAASFYTYNLHMALRGGISSLTTRFDPRALNLILITSHVGLGCYIYRRRVFEHLPQNRRLFCTAYITVIFHFGSFLLTSVLKDFILQDPVNVRKFLAFLVAFGGLGLGYTVSKFLDNKDDKQQDNKQH